MTDTQAVLLLFGIYVLGGLLTLGMAPYYKQPIMGAWTIPGAVMVGLGGFGFIAAAATSIVNAIPGALISLLAGVAMISVLISAFEESWVESNKYRYGTFFALIIGLSGVSFYDIGTPFWSLVGGIVISLIVETNDWKIASTTDQASEKTETIEA